jgi:hypothetical protein
MTIRTPCASRAVTWKEVLKEISHLNCGRMHPSGLPAANGTGGFFKPGDVVIHRLLTQLGDGLALVDTRRRQEHHHGDLTILHLCYSVLIFNMEIFHFSTRRVDKIRLSTSGDHVSGMRAEFKKQNPCWILKNLSGEVAHSVLPNGTMPRKKIQLESWIPKTMPVKTLT